MAVGLSPLSSLNLNLARAHMSYVQALAFSDVYFSRIK